MSRRKDDTPSVATFADHEVITPPHDLRKAVVPVMDEDDDPVGRAEAALAQLSGEFGAWMDAEVTHGALFRAAHDIKGEAGTFGFPAVVGAADSLCRLLEHSPDTNRIPTALIDQHVDAVRAIVREYARDDLVHVAGSLTRRLRDVTDEFLKTENGFRPDYLEGLLAQSLAPGA
jgi:HPt (histidine-containing phosphotransfer) domain-containing protein